MTQRADTAVADWIQTVVVGLGLCPFAARPMIESRVRITECNARSDEAALKCVYEAALALMQSDATETTLVVLTEHVTDFGDYLDLLDLAEGVIEHFGWSGKLQIASFHPDYQFADAAPDDAGNLTNRAPYPIFQLLREASVTLALSGFGDPSKIPQRNVATMRGLTAAQRAALFPWVKAVSAQPPVPSVKRWWNGRAKPRIAG